MASHYRIDYICEQLTSNKFTERKKASETFLSVLQNVKTIEELNENGERSWNNILVSINKYLAKEAVKALEDKKKKGTQALLNGDIFYETVKLIVREGKNYNVQTILKCISNCLEDEGLGQYCIIQYLNTLKTIMLPNEYIRCHIDACNWDVMFKRIKSRFRDEIDLHRKDAKDILETIAQYLKYGPLHGFSPEILRGQFDFISKLCKEISVNFSRPIQSAVIEIAYYLCYHTAKDNRMSCCKLGEETFSFLISLYEIQNPRDDGMKIQLLKYFLMQLVMHNPRGVSEGHPGAYAYCWKTWNNCLKSIHEKCYEDISHSQKLYPHYNNEVLFLVDKGIKLLQEDFARLLAEVIKQMDVKYRKDENRSFQEENKRIKLISPVAELIDKIEETQQWPWINEMCTLIDLYPNVLNENCFIQLLQILSKLQVDCKDNTVAHHIYCCLCLLKDIQPSLQLDNKAEVKNTWIVIRDTTLRSFGLNQNDPKLHFLLQKLIHTDNIIPEPLLRTYTSEVLDVTESNLKTLNSTFSCLNCTQNENQSHTLIKWILSKNSSDNYNYFTKCITAKILVSLIVKRWPIFDEVADVGSSIIEKERLFDDIGDIYLKTAFENSMIPESQKENCSIKNNEPKKRKIILNDSANTVLMSSLQNLLDNMQGLKNESKKILFFINVLALIKNVISYSLNFEILSEDEMNENILFNMITPIFNNVNTILTNCFKLKHLDDLKIASLNDCVVCFYEMMSTFLNPFFDRKFRKIIPTDLLKTLISFLHTETRENKIDFKDLRLPLQNFRIMVIKSLVYYSCGMRTFSSPTEKFMFNALAEFDYNIHEHSSCDLTMAFLRSIRECKLDMLDVSSIKLILALLRKLCEARYEYYSSATEILQFIHDIGPVVECGGSDESKSLFSNLLYPFYKERNNYGPGFSVILVNCIGKFHQMDPDCAFTKWEGSEVALKLPEFLCSAYQEVRFAASQNLIQLFKSSPSRKNLRDYHLQEIIFEDICNKCEKIFEVEGSLTRERKVDEAVTRSAVVLQLLSSITIVSDRWREESLFALLKVVHKRRLEPFAKVLNMVSTRLSLENEIVFLEKYFTVLLRRWIHDGLSFSDFPISMFGCDNKTSFYTKYLSDIVPFLIVFDKESLDVISECTAKSIAIILQTSISIICVDSMVSDITNISQDVFERNELIRYVLQHIQKEELLTLFTEKIDEILLYLISMVRDEQDLSDNFHVSVMFAKSYIKTITIANFKSVLNFIKEILGFEKPLITILFTQQVHKLQQVMMQLIIKINNSIAAEDKLQIFHHYIIMNDLIIENFDLSDARDYFIRDFCYVFMRFIRNHEKCPELSKFVLIYFRKSLVRLFDYSEILCKHFASIATTLVDIVMERKIEEISELSLNLLKFLIIDNTQHFEEVIKHMDNIPDSPFLTELIRIQSDLKYDGKETHLKEEIQNFINFVNISRNYSSRIDSLRRLKMHLFCEKRQLKKLYEQLSNLKGFSEDCENSCLHQLISILVDLSQSKDKDISMEALKCLGELGPSDLMTLVVKPEKHLTYMNSTPFEFFTGQVISLLNIYLIDDDIRLLQPSAAILYSALNSKEGRKVLQSNEDYGCGSIASQYLFPFMVIEKPKSVSFKIGIEQLIRKINLDELWHPNTSIHYDNWLKDLVCNILETVADSYVPQLIHVCHLKVELCEVLLPSLIYLLISLNNNKINKIIATQLNKFFDEHWSATLDSSSEKNVIVKNKKAVQVMLNVVHFVRVNKSNMKLKKNLEDLNLDYLKIAKAAQYCSAFFTALLYVELWCHSTFEGLETGGVSFKTTILDSIFEAEKEEASLAVVNLMRSSYIAIGDQDSLQGCGTSLLLNPQRRIEHYEDSGMWDQAILFHNMQISRGISNSKRMLIDSYKRYGLYETSLLCKEQDDVPDYECMWRLSDWTLPEMKRPIQNTQITFEEQMEKCRYFTLKSIHERDICGVMEHIEYARLSVVEKLKHTSLESSSNLYGILAHLQGLNEIEDFLNASSTDDLHLVLKKWERQDNIDKNSFYNIEPIMVQRITILNEYFKTSELEDASLYKKYLINLALKLSERARLENKTHIGMRALAFIQNLPQLSLDEKCRMALEDAQLCWKTNNKHTGRRILHQLYGDQNIDPRLKSYALKLNGEWSVESYSEHPNAIIKDYFLESLTIYKDLEKNKNDLKSIFDTYDTLGRFADKQYQQVSIHMTSDVFQKKMTNMQKAEETLKQLSKKSAPTLDERRAKAFHNAQKSIDKAEIENTRKEKDCFLHLALKYHLRSLTHSDDNNLQIFRVLALFLENRTCESIRELIEDEIPKIPSYKFLTILPQLTPHIANRNNNDYFSQQANNIIERCAREHPHHTLPIVLGLANSHKDSEYNDSQAKSSINEERVSEAKKLIKLFKNYSILTDIVTRLEMIFDASIQLAYLAPKTEHADRERKRRFNIPKNLKISKIRNFDSIPVLTDTLPIQKNKNYDNIIGIHSFDKYYELVGGLNAPKKIICIGTDGKPREQLVKGQDDLRQDAVMQQVFTIMNSLLSLNKQTCGLKIRTYKIIPLSMRSGVLEWAKNTMPIGLYLLGDDENMGAHQIYRPQDKSPSQCRKTMKDAANSNAEQKLIVFRRICENFKPVFHKFFEENFLHPTVWFERRRAYIQSVATTSMCGYILGIGDRHLSNILIDKTTAEVIHIDFGIAFEQGRTLPTPETVPFRLSRDFVDAMGVSGVEGAFKRSCEKTMTVMRDNYQTIMAILGVLLYDPLYSWTVSAAEATKRQRGSLDETGSYARTSPQAYETDISVNTTAERALLRLKAKLHGIEDGTPMSIEHQVGVLIHQAMDPVNLSKLFCGWQAHV